MSYERVRLKSETCFLGRRAVKLSQLNLRITIALLFFIVLLGGLMHMYRKVSLEESKHVAIKKYLMNLFSKKSQGSDESEWVDEDADIIWSNQTVELLHDQLGLIAGEVINDGKYKCKHGEEFLLSALPGPDASNLYEALWQYFSIEALAHVTIQYEGVKKMSLKAVVTDRMKTHLVQLFEGLPLIPISHIPSSCYNLSHTKIIGNISPIQLKSIDADTPFLLDPPAKRWSEIAQRWALKIKPFWRIRPTLMNKVQQELLIAKAALGIEPTRDNDLNFIGIYVTNDDKLPAEYYHEAMNFHRRSAGLSVFMVICDSPLLAFCRQVFEYDKNSALFDARVVQKSSDEFDFALMAQCNGTIISNDKGILHALMNGGTAVVLKSKSDPQFYVPWLMSELMENWYSISDIS